jgi:hypothetical protein
VVDTVTGGSSKRSRTKLVVSLVVAAAVGATTQQVIKHESKVLGMSRLELHILLSVVGAATSRLIAHEVARRSVRATPIP